MFMQRLLIIAIVIVVLLVGGYVAINRYNQKPGKDPESLTPHRGTLSGEYICLPPEGERTLETPDCHFAVKTEDGKIYVVDFNLMSQDRPDLKVGDRFTANGVITPIENLSMDYWQKYPTRIEGIFSVTDSVQKH